MIMIHKKIFAIFLTRPTTVERLPIHVGFVRLVTSFAEVLQNFLSNAKLPLGFGVT